MASFVAIVAETADQCVIVKWTRQYYGHRTTYGSCKALKRRLTYFLRVTNFAKIL